MQASHYLTGSLIACFILSHHKNAARSGGAETVNKTRSMVPSELESPLLSVPQPPFLPPTHAPLLQLSFTLTLVLFLFIKSSPHVYPREPDRTSARSETWSCLSIDLLVVWLWQRFLGANDNHRPPVLTFLHRAMAFGHVVSDTHVKLMTCW